MDKKSEEVKVDSNERITQIMIRMLEGEEINLFDVMAEYKVSKRTIQRDASKIKRSLRKYHFNFDLKHDTENEIYVLKRTQTKDDKEIFALMKLLLGTRAFGKDELEQVTDILEKSVGINDLPSVNKMLRTFRANYSPINDHPRINLIALLWKLNDCIEKQKAIQFDYANTDPERKNHSKSHIGVPLSLYFDSHFFYAVIYTTESGDKVVNDTRLYRLDRFVDLPVVKRSKIKVPRQNIMNEKSMRDRTFALSSGEIISYVFEYKGYFETALNQLPNAIIKRDANNQIIRNKDGWMTIEGRISQNGAYAWVMSQGKNVRVKYPESLIKRVKADLQATLNNY